jgi:hypothetical protein
MKNLAAISLVLASCLGAIGCGGGGDTAASTRDAERGAEALGTTAPTPPEEANPHDWEALKRLAGSHAGRLIIPSGPVPERAVIRDLKLGRGPVLREGDTFRVRWMTYTFKDGKPLDRYWLAPRTYTWGVGRAVDAWEVGLKGIHMGGIRELIVPASLGYEDAARVYVVQPLKIL